MCAPVCLFATLCILETNSDKLMSFLWDEWVVVYVLLCMSLWCVPSDTVDGVGCVC